MDNKFCFRWLAAAPESREIIGPGLLRVILRDIELTTEEFLAQI